MIMLDKCLNPACSAKFRTLRNGRVFVKEVDVGFDDGGKEHSHKPAYFWLCGSCCRTMTVVARERARSQAYSARGAVPATSQKPLRWVGRRANPEGSAYVEHFTFPSIATLQLEPAWISESVLRRFVAAR